MSSPESKHWHFLTSHTQVLLCLRRDRDARLRDVAATVGITERATQRILSDLVEAGYVTRERLGRRNRYTVNAGLAMRHPSQFEHQIVELLDLLQLERPSGRVAENTASAAPGS